MFKKYMSLNLLGLVVFIIVCETESGTLRNTLEKGVSKIRCNVHNLGHLVFNHNHHEDPCKDKSHVGPNQLENNYDSNNKYPGIQKGNGREHATTEVSKPNESSQVKKNISDTVNSRTLINPGANCPNGYRANSNGKCFLSL